MWGGGIIVGVKDRVHDITHLKNPKPKSSQTHLLRSSSDPHFIFFFTLPFQSRDFLSHGLSPDQSPDFHHMIALLF